MTSFGPLTVFADDDRVYGLENPLRFAQEEGLPPEHEIKAMCAYYRANLQHLAPGATHGSNHELAAWLLTSSAQLIAENRTDDAIDVLNEADHLLVGRLAFPNDPLWRAAVFYNIAVCFYREPPGRPYEESVFQVRTARQLLARATHADANPLSLSCVERAVSESERLIEFHDRLLGGPPARA